MLLLFAHDLDRVRGGPRDCVGAWADNELGLQFALEAAERSWHGGRPPSAYRFCALYRASSGSLEFVARRMPGFRWETREEEHFADALPHRPPPEVDLEGPADPSALHT